MDKSGFFDKVYEIVKQIPHGRVTTYGSIAEFLGSKGSARMVGWALNGSRNKLENIPAHRVVNKAGLLTGKNYFGGNNVMAQLLESEGIIINSNKIMNFSDVFWNPIDHISISNF